MDLRLNIKSFSTLIITAIYLVLELAFRSYAVDRMGDVNLFQVEVEYLEIVGRIFASTGLSLFAINYFMGEFYRFKGKLIGFACFFAIFFYAQKVVFDNLHWFVSEESEQSAYPMFLFKQAVFLEKGEERWLPFDYEEQDSIKAKTLYGMMPFTYASSESAIEYAQLTEDQTINKIVSAYWDEGNIDHLERVAFRLRKQTVWRLIDAHEHIAQFLPGSDKHKELLERLKENGGTAVIGGQRVDKYNVLDVYKKRAGYYDFIDEELPKMVQNIYGTKLTDRQKDHFVDMVKTAQFHRVYTDPVLIELGENSSNELFADKELLKAVIPKVNDYDDYYYWHRDYKQDFMPIFKERHREEIKALKDKTHEAVKAAYVPPLVMMLSTFAIILNVWSLLMGLLNRIFWVHERKGYAGFLLFCFIMLIPATMPWKTDADRQFFNEMTRDAGLLRKGVTHYMTGTNIAYDKMLGRFNEFSMLWFENILVDEYSGLDHASYERAMMRDRRNEMKTAFLESFESESMKDFLTIFF